ncbi:hypothetical protein [Brachybacterium massiliense]|uniref:hypothetical protein n=1 Tax=Brachybacterium massiliense TaxID=1755098 RepID=UPI0014829FC7|nr:hypothetical protein [Brachybacterium massiliense]
MAWFVRTTVDNALQSPELWGITWWCSHDVSRSLADFPPLEHTLGLFDEDGRLKSAGAAFRDAIAAARELPAPAPRGRAIELPVGPEPLRRRSAAAPGGAVFEQWMEASRPGNGRRSTWCASMRTSSPATPAPAAPQQLAPQCEQHPARGCQSRSHGLIVIDS